MDVPEHIHRRFKGHLAAACQALRVPFSDFARLTDLNQFLLDVAEIDCPKTLAEKALTELKADTGGSKYVSCVAILDLLDNEFGAPVSDPTRERRLKDLKQLVDTHQNEQAFREFMNAWYD